MKKWVVLVILLYGCILIGSHMVSSLNIASHPNVLEIRERLAIEDSVEVMVNKPFNKLVGVDGSIHQRDLESGGFLARITAADLEDLLDSGMTYIEPIREFETHLADAVNIINASKAWPLQVTSLNLTGVTQTICIIDTGVNYTHPDLAGRNATACNINCVGQSCAEDCDITDLNGHGTHVTGIAVAQGGIVGIANEAKFIGLKVFPGSSRTGASPADIANAINWCVARSETYNISAISMSFGTVSLYDSYCDSTFDYFANATDAAFAKNISVVASTGNANGSPRNTTAISSPACIQNATAVSATDDDDSLSSYGHYSSLVKLLAPGTSINSTCTPSDSDYADGYCVKTGTSMSTPMVAGTIAIMKQLLTLYGNSKTPLEIEDVLNNTGVRVTDGSLNFTRINTFNAILALDTQNPTVTLIEPTDNLVNFHQNKTFSCNATDLQLANLTLFVYNGSGVYNQSTVFENASAVNLSLNLNAIPLGSYEWNCLGADTQGNSVFASSNYSFTIGGVAVTLTSPLDNNYTNVSNQTFSCNLQSEPGGELTNATFYLWNSTELINSSFMTIGSGNTSFDLVSNYSFTAEGNYNWNCEGFNNNTNSSLAVRNYSIVYDITSPNLTVSSPANGASYSASSQTIDFVFNTSDSSPRNCSLIANGAIRNSTSISGGSDNLSLSVTFNEGSYSWNVQCVDFAGNRNESASRSFSISAPVITSSGSGGSSGGGGGGGGTTSVPTQNASDGTLVLTPPQSPDEPEIVTSDDGPQLGPQITLGELIANFAPIVLGVIILFIAAIYLARYMKWHKAVIENQKVQNKKMVANAV